MSIILIYDSHGYLIHFLNPFMKLHFASVYVSYCVIGEFIGTYVSWCRFYAMISRVLKFTHLCAVNILERSCNSLDNFFACVAEQIFICNYGLIFLVHFIVSDVAVGLEL
jgi:hypothetical protein